MAHREPPSAPTPPATGPKPAPGPVRARPRLHAALTAGLVLVLIVALMAAGRLLRPLLGDVGLLAPAALGVRAGMLLLSLAALYALVVRWRGYGAAALGLRVRRATLGQAAGGAAGGAGAALAAFGLAAGAGGYVALPAPPGSHPGPEAMLAGLLAIALLATWEELMTRSGMVGVLVTAWPRPVAVGVPGVLFGLLHLPNPGASALAALNTVLAGVFLGLLFLDPAGRPGVPSLGLATGFHLGWNYALGWVLCVPVSGLEVPWRWVELRSVDALWSGGAYGLEGGLAATAVYALLIAGAARRQYRGRRPPA